VYRAQATLAGMADHLHIAPIALALLVAGCLFLRGDREQARLGNPAWPWLACLGSLATIFVTYVNGYLDIHGWLGTSVSRTTIFAQVVLYSEVAVWLVIAAQAASAWMAGLPARSRAAVPLAPPGMTPGALEVSRPRLNRRHPPFG
jgi:hypothetical protein